MARIDTEIIEGVVSACRRELGAREPARGKFLPAVGHVLAAEDTERQHFLRCQLGFELRIEISPDRFRQDVTVAPLHLVVDDHELSSAPLAGFNLIAGFVLNHRLALHFEEG